MKIIKISCAIVIFSLFYSCEKESAPPIKIPESFLRGVINNTDSLKVNSPNQHSGYGYDPNQDGDFSKEGPHMTFPFNSKDTEAVNITFLLKFDSLNRPPFSEMPFVKDTDALIDSLVSPGWCFTYGFSQNTCEKVVIIDYRIWTDSGHIFYGLYKGQDSDSNHSVPIFLIDEAIIYEHPKKGSGILINGKFSCTMYNSRDYNDSLIFNSIRYQGFIKHPWESWFN